MIKTLRLASTIVLELVGAFLFLNLCLWILDYPAIDSYSASHVKKLRYPSRHQVYRDEDYSRYAVNSFGLVGTEPAPLSQANVYRIAVFGDSIVEALQVGHEAKFTTLLERVIHPPPPYVRVEVWNFGFSGDNTGNAFARWLYQCKHIPFNLVLFTFNDTDVMENRPSEVSGSAGAFLVTQDDGEFRLDESRIDGDIGKAGYWVKGTFDRLFYSIFILKGRVKDILQLKTDRVKAFVYNWFGSQAVAGSSEVKPGGLSVLSTLASNTCRQLRHVQSRISETGTPVLIVGLPTGAAMLASDLAQSSLRRDGYLEVAKCLEQSGVPFVNTYPALASSIAQQADPYGDWDPGAHYNRLGHRIVAEVVLSALTARYQFTVQTGLGR